MFWCFNRFILTKSFGISPVDHQLAAVTYNGCSIILWGISRHPNYIDLKLCFCILRDLHWLTGAVHIWLERWCWPSRPSMELHTSTSKHWSDRMREPSTSLHYISGLACTPITDSKQRSNSKVTTLLCSGASVVEWTPDQCQDGVVACHLPLKTQD